MEVKESDKSGVVCLLFHKDGSPFHELNHYQVYSPQEYEANNTENGFFNTYGGAGLDHEVLWDVRVEAEKAKAAKEAEEAEAKSKKEADELAKKEADKAKKETEKAKKTTEAAPLTEATEGKK